MLIDHNGPPVVEAMIREILSSLRRDGPGTLPCGISLHDGRSYRFYGGTEEFADTIEYIQMAAGEGPGRDVVDSGYALTLIDLRSDPRWPIFKIAAALHGLVSLHCEPLRGADGHPIGTITWYSTSVGTFTHALRRDLATCARVVALTLGVLDRSPTPQVVSV